MIFFDKTRTIGQDANGKNVVWVSIYVDTAANLPAYNDYQSDGFIMCMASEGRCIDTGDLYRLDSAGTWQISQAGTGTYTKAEIDALLNAKQDVLSFDATPTQNSTNPVTSGGIWTDQQRQDDMQSEDRAALVELVDGGAKNLSRWNSGTSTSAQPTLAQRIPFNSDGGEYTISYNTDLTTGTLYIGFKDSGGAATITVEIGNANKIETITIPANTAYFNVYAPAYGDYSNFMICTKAAWDMSHAFQPYRPSWQEMYDIILALQ